MELVFRRYIFVILLFLCVTKTFAVDSCIAESDHCSCKFPNGTYVSLQVLDNKNGIQFPTLKDSVGFTYEYNPCTPFSLGDPDKSDCAEVLVCQVSSDKSDYDNCGSPNDFETSMENGHVVFTYQGGKRKLQEWERVRRTKITLKCDPKSKIPTVSDVSQDEIDDTLYSFSITSKCACAGGCPLDPTHGGSKRLSIGSSLLIVVFVLLVIYLIAGILFNKYKREKSGTDMIPNKEFWKDFPGLIKDGIVFTKDKMCNRNNEYQEIR